MKKVSKKKSAKKTKLNFFAKTKKNVKSFLNRRPHRSFKMTKRRDYKRTLIMPGYIAFTKEVLKFIWKNKKIFILLGLFYALATLLTIGMLSQETYTTLTDTINSSEGELFEGFWGTLGKAGILGASVITGGTSSSTDQTQQIFTIVILLMTWLTSVWLARNILAGHKVKLRDGLYNSLAPILSTALIVILMMIQLLPIAIALIGYSAAVATGLLSGGVEAMLFWVAACSLGALSVYWITSSFFALIIVTLPGMYPYQALKFAGDMVIGRRLKILFRILWMALIALVSWALILIPIILLDLKIKDTWENLSGIPIVPVVVLIMSSLTMIWVSNYVYLFYRKVVADENDPA